MESDATTSTTTTKLATNLDNVQILKATAVPTEEDPETKSPTRILLSSEDTIPAKVLWKRDERSYTDIFWAVLYVASYLSFLSCGFYIISQSHDRFEWVTEESSSSSSSSTTRRTRVLSSHFRNDVKMCCDSIVAEKHKVAYGSLCEYLGSDYFDDDDRRRLQAGDSKFDGDEGMFDAFLEAPEIIVGLLSFTIFTVIVWVLLLRFFAKTVVLVTEVVKVGVLIFMGVAAQESVGSRVICWLAALGLILYDWCFRKKILFACEMLKQSTIAMKENVAMFVGLIFIKGLYVLNAFVFVLFFSKAFNIVRVEKEESYCDSYDGTCTSGCYYQQPDYVHKMATFLGISYLWTIILFSTMRLSVISNVVGSWRFHPEDKPTVLRAVINTTTTSFGTLAVASLITTVAERINRIIQEPVWKSWVSPAVCITAPLQLLLCCFGECIRSLIVMLTKFSVILHVFTSLPFLGSAKKVFKIMKRHFVGGFVVETTSRSVLNFGSYLFSIGITMLAWAWLDDRFDCQTLDGGGDTALFFLWIFVGLFNLWYPVLGIYIIILINRFLKRMEHEKSLNGGSDGDVDHSQHLWICPLAAIFVGCIAMMFFSYLSGVFLDTIDVLFLCHAVEKDNNLDMTENEFNSLVQSMPEYIEVIDSEITSPHSGKPEQPLPTDFARHGDDFDLEEATKSNELPHAARID